MSTNMNTSNSNPGGGPRSKEVTGRMVLICFVTFFAVVGGVNAVMIRAAVSTFGGVDTANAYQAGLAFAREIAAVEEQDARHWDVRAHITTEAGATALEVVAVDGAGAPLSRLDATARLVHPTDKRADHVVALDEIAPGRFKGRTDELVGQRDVVIELARDGTRLFRSRNRVFVRAAVDKES
jgi:nitrogen fixation protein FixH